MVDVLNHLLIFGVAIVAGLFNALAGGGTLFLFPVLLSVGLSPVVASATSASALLTGYASSAYAYRDLLKKWSRHIKWLLLTVILGSGLGAYLLTIVSEQAFKNLIPILLFLATLLFALNHKLFQFSNLVKVKQFWFCQCLLLLTSIYGGFFGAGMGIMIMVALQLGYQSIQQQLAIKHIISLTINMVSVSLFIIADLIDYAWLVTAMLGAIVGGYLGSRWSLCLSAIVLRRIVIVLGGLLTLIYAYQIYI